MGVEGAKNGEWNNFCGLGVLRARLSTEPLLEIGTVRTVRWTGAPELAPTGLTR